MRESRAQIKTLDSPCRSKSTSRLKAIRKRTTRYFAAYVRTYFRMLSRLGHFEAIARSAAKLSLPTGMWVRLKQYLHFIRLKREISTRRSPRKSGSSSMMGILQRLRRMHSSFLIRRSKNIRKYLLPGFSLMMQAFDPKGPKILLTPLKTVSDVDEQDGYRFVFAGAIKAIRNPRAHEFRVESTTWTCLDHLGFVSLLLRRLEQAGYKTPDHL